MRAAVVAAVIAALPPTVGILLTYLQARATRREASREREAATARTLEVLGGALERLQASVERVESGVGDLRERVGRLEGAAAERRRLRA